MSNPLNLEKSIQQDYFNKSRNNKADVQTMEIPEDLDNEELCILIAEYKHTFTKKVSEKLLLGYKPYGNIILDEYKRINLLMIKDPKKEI